GDRSQSPRRIGAGARNSPPVKDLRQPPPEDTGGAATRGGSAVMGPEAASCFPYLYAALAAASSWCWMVLMLFGFSRNFWKMPHSPWPVVEPNAAGWLSDMSNTAAFAFASGDSVRRVIASG